MTNIVRLYTVATTVRFYRGCTDVELMWFCSGRSSQPTRRPHYAELIEKYDPAEENIGYAERQVEELFTEDEAKQLKGYLDEVTATRAPRLSQRLDCPYRKTSSASVPSPSAAGVIVSSCTSARGTHCPLR
jgi:hypothetical protein